MATPGHLASSSSITQPWKWILEKMIDMKELDTPLLKEIIAFIPDIEDKHCCDLLERIAIRYLEEVLALGVIDAQAIPLVKILTKSNAYQQTQLIADANGSSDKDLLLWVQTEAVLTHIRGRRADGSRDWGRFAEAFDHVFPRDESDAKYVKRRKELEMLFQMQNDGIACSQMLERYSIDTLRKELHLFIRYKKSQLGQTFLDQILLDITSGRYAPSSAMIHRLHLNSNSVNGSPKKGKRHISDNTGTGKEGKTQISCRPFSGPATRLRLRDDAGKAVTSKSPLKQGTNEAFSKVEEETRALEDQILASASGGAPVVGGFQGNKLAHFSVSELKQVIVDSVPGSEDRGGESGAQLSKRVTEMPEDEEWRPPDHSKRSKGKHGLIKEKECQTNEHKGDIEGPDKVVGAPFDDNADKNVCLNLLAGEGDTQDVDLNGLEILELGDDGHEELCHKCKKGGTLLCCDGCPIAVHKRCLGPNASQALEENEWFCPVCVQRKALEAVLKAKKEAREARKRLAEFVTAASNRNTFSGRTHGSSELFGRRVALKVSRQRGVSAANNQNGIKTEAKKSTPSKNILVDSIKHSKENEIESSQEHGRGNGKHCSSREYPDEGMDRHGEVGMETTKKRILGTNVSEARDPSEISGYHAPQEADGDGHDGDLEDDGGDSKIEDDLQCGRMQDLGRSRGSVQGSNTRVRRHYTVNRGNRIIPGVRRKNLPWSELEVDTLKEGINRFSHQGKSGFQWGLILEFGHGKFRPSRTTVDLKDKWRNLAKKI